MKKRRVMPMLMAGIFTVSAILGGCSQGGDDKGADAQKGSGSSKQETDANIYEYTKDDLDGRPSFSRSIWRIKSVLPISRNGRIFFPWAARYPSRMLR